MANNLILSYSDGNGLLPMNFKELTNSEVIPIQNKNSLQDYDSFLHEELTDNIFKRDFDRIFIPISLNEFYLPFTGIILGLHFRLTQNENRKNLLPIIFYADENETKEFIARHSIYGYFLFTKGVHLISDNIEDFKEISSKNLKPIDKTYVEIELVKRVIIPAPSFYDSRHSIANEWALINLDNISGHNVLSEEKKLENIKTNLFVKWLLAKSKISITPESEDGKSLPPKAKFIIPNSKGKKVLLIEDEWNKGWLELWRAFLPEAEVDYIPIEKNTTLEDLKKLIAEKIKGSDYDLFLLDIRLLDSDHNEDDFEKYSGYEVLIQIKDKNKGYQVTLTSASNKQWIYDYGREIGAGGVFIKPGLEVEVDNKFLEQNIQKPINMAFRRGFLKEIYSEQLEIQELLRSAKKRKLIDKKVCQNIDSYLKIGFEALLSPFSNDLIVAFLNYFQIIEYLIKEYISDDRLSGVKPDKSYWEFRDGSKKLKYIKIKEDIVIAPSNLETGKKGFPSTPQKVYNFLNYYCAFVEAEPYNSFNELNSIRNNYVHPEQDNKSVVISVKEICKQTDFLFAVLNAFLIRL